MLNQIRQDVEMIIRFEKHILMRRGVIPSITAEHPSHEPDEQEWAMFEKIYATIEPFLRPLPAAVQGPHHERADYRSSGNSHPRAA